MIVLTIVGTTLSGTTTVSIRLGTSFGPGAKLADGLFVARRRSLEQAEVDLALAPADDLAGA